MLDDTAPIPGTRRARTRTAFEENAGAAQSELTYLWEAFYGVPVSIAIALQRAGHYTEALDWFRLAYDYTRPLSERKSFFPLLAEEQIAGSVAYGESVLAWLRDPLDVHAIAATRPSTFTRATILLIVRCLIEYGDSEFTTDTSEAIERARLLYETAIELLATPELQQSYMGCDDVIARFVSRIGDPTMQGGVRLIAGRLSTRLPVAVLASSLEEIVTAVSDLEDPEAGLDAAERIAARMLAATAEPPTLLKRRERPRRRSPCERSCCAVLAWRPPWRPSEGSRSGVARTRALTAPASTRPTG